MPSCSVGADCPAPQEQHINMSSCGHAAAHLSDAKGCKEGLATADDNKRLGMSGMLKR